MSVATHPVSASDYRRGALLVTGAIVVWSTAGVLARWVDVDPWTTLFWRSVFAAASLLAYLVFRDGARWADGFRRLGRVGQELALALTNRWPMSCVNPTVLPKLDRRRWQPISMERGPNS